MRSARRSRRVVVAALALVFMAPGFLPVALAGPLSPASPAPPYLSGLGTQFRAESNDDWGGRAKGLSADMSTNPLNKPPGEHDPYTLVWVKQCGRGQQQATFSRSLELPGRPSEGAFTISPVLGSDLVGRSPFRSWSLKVNGGKVASGKLDGASWSSVVETLEMGDLREFRDGANQVQLKVSRAALPSGMKKCNTTAANQVAVAFNLAGDFAADLALADDVPATYYSSIDEEGFASAQFYLTVRNLGPSGAVAGGDFTVLTSGVPFVAAGSSPTDPQPGAPFESCTRSSSDNGRFDCVLGKMKNGDQGKVYVGLAHNFGSDQISQHQATLTWRVFHPADPSATVDERSVTVVFCGDQATDPGCPAAD